MVKYWKLTMQQEGFPKLFGVAKKNNKLFGVLIKATIEICFKDQSSKYIPKVLLFLKPLELHCAAQARKSTFEYQLFTTYLLLHILKFILSA